MELDALIDQVRTAAAQADEAGRAKLLRALRALQPTLETEKDLHWRLGRCHLLITTVRLGQDLDVFRSLVAASAADTPLSSQQVASKSPFPNASPALVTRILRHLAAMSLVAETGPDAFLANKATHALATEKSEGTLHMFGDAIGRVAVTLPEYFAKRGYQDIPSGTQLPFQLAYNSDKPWYQFVGDSPEMSKWLQSLMLVVGEDELWFKAFPFEDEIKGFRGDTVLVDVSGGFGQQCAALIAGLPHLELKGRLVVQDLASTVDLGVRHEGVEAQARDLFAEQKVKGARFYYLRNILHNWPDAECVEMMKRLAEALGDESQILIDEVVLPDQGAAPEATNMDLVMMGFMGSRERTAGEFERILDQAGLKSLRTIVYAHGLRNAIIQVVKK
ncbi:S-adenosyl-L-methionine-dependent methyltransferase [Cladorrhinum samala]|uniref:S-adenosyl-L-methionine-dependent methyltransferase n=1 Tax=Cladorrhinum samala TaxID=585594 RepID=A0AAV9H8D8_9PEZI|nr:S-adenosyl-L-methionine-dependent methyltransferase [Cladorrhinum samala]